MDWAISTENEALLRMAYSLGAFTGDGWSQPYVNYGNGGWYTVGISCQDREIVERFCEEIAECFGKHYAINEYRAKSGCKMFTCSSKRRAVYDFFVDQTVMKTRVPAGIARAEKHIIKHYIAGLFDTDGTVVFNSANRYQLKFGSVERVLVGDVAYMLQRCGVKVGKIGQYDKGGYRTHYTIQPNIRSFIEAGFYFGCERKAARLEDYSKKVLVASETVYADAATAA